MEKLKFMVFKPRQKRYCLDIQLFINNECIEQVNETMFLGVILDENLSWKSHLSHLANKFSKSIGVIYQASFCLYWEIPVSIVYLFAEQISDNSRCVFKDQNCLILFLIP